MGSALKASGGPGPEDVDAGERRPIDPELLATELGAEGLWFPPEVLVDAIAVLGRPGIALIGGPGGVGKSSLARIFARHATRAHRDLGVEVVTVRPDWTSPSDLAGHYDEASGRYRSTRFLDLWMRALRHKAKPYFAILEGFDLAPPELYLAEILAARDAGPPLSLHAEPLRCRPRDGIGEGLESFFVCHQDCGTCFFVAAGYPRGITDAVRDFVPARVQWPPNLHLIGILSGPVTGLPERIKDAASYLGLVAPPVEELIPAARLAGLAGRLAMAIALDRSLRSRGEALSPRIWREVDAMVGQGIELGRAVLARAGARLAHLGELATLGSLRGS